ncbi:MAG TPA: DUF2946 family protein [Casimicrobiaceae bacterium]|jgi:hypothetical protein
MTSRRLAITLLTLAMHLLVPLGAYAAVPTVASGDFCSAATKSAAPPDDRVLEPQRVGFAGSSAPAPSPRHPAHSHCPSCSGGSVAAAMLPAATPFVVRPVAFARAAAASAGDDIAPGSVQLPPLRGPPSFIR